MADGEKELERDGILRQVGGSSARHAALLPTRTVQCHAANLMPLANGDLACVWFAGTQEGLSDISVHISLLSKGSERWTEARSEQNPILFPAPDGRLELVAAGRDDRRKHVVDVASGELGDPTGLRARCGAAVEQVVPGLRAEQADCSGCLLSVHR